MDMKKLLLLIVVLVYVLSPVDLLPGPIDDIIVILLAWNRRDD